MNKIIYAALISLLIFTACSHNDNFSPENVKRLDSELRKGSLPSDSLMAEATRKLFAISGYGELNDSSIEAYTRNKMVVMSASRMDSVWGTDASPSPQFIQLEKQLGSMKERMAQKLPSVKMPELYAVVSPFNQSVFTVDSTLFLALNHYLGADYELYGYFPDYIRRRKEPSRVTSDVGEALIRRDFPYSPNEEYPTVLSRILYEGAVVEAVKELTGKDAREVLGYNEDEWRWLERNEEEMWRAMASRKMLFSTDEMTAAMLTNLSPATNILHVESPGFAGRYIGYRIVEKYRKNNEATLEDLLLPTFYDGKQTLSQSGY